VAVILSVKTNDGIVMAADSSEDGHRPSRRQQVYPTRPAPVLTDAFQVRLNPIVA